MWVIHAFNNVSFTIYFTQHALLKEDRDDSKLARYVMN